MIIIVFSSVFSCHRWNKRYVFDRNLTKMLTIDWFIVFVSNCLFESNETRNYFHRQDYRACLPQIWMFHWAYRDDWDVCRCKKNNTTKKKKKSRSDCIASFNHIIRCQTIEIECKYLYHSFEHDHDIEFTCLGRTLTLSASSNIYITYFYDLNMSRECNVLLCESLLRWPAHSFFSCIQRTASRISIEIVRTRTWRYSID
jgi:hypothetical protein